MVTLKMIVIKFKRTMWAAFNWHRRGKRGVTEAGKEGKKRNPAGGKGAVEGRSSHMTLRNVRKTARV